ncbi:hypothetical protein [Rhizorhabdus dicambivorans]|uniref:hypothetical protein n=1 Tax=Rhizorhabdus dicambivorans TaxID=1850238 RepID=UPI001EDD4FE5|nr:hypothetical protein [Rhizorhabdus dicambivorans]
MIETVQRHFEETLHDAATVLLHQQLKLRGGPLEGPPRTRECRMLQDFHGVRPIACCRLQCGENQHHGVAKDTQIPRAVGKIGRRQQFERGLGSVPFEAQGQDTDIRIGQVLLQRFKHLENYLDENRLPLRPVERDPLAAHQRKGRLHTLDTADFEPRKGCRDRITIIGSSRRNEIGNFFHVQALAAVSA